MNLRTVAIVAILVTSGIAILPGTAQAGTQTGNDSDIWRQMSFSTSNGGGVSSSTNSLTLTAGTEYFIAASSDYSGGSVSGSTTLFFQVGSLFTLSDTDGCAATPTFTSLQSGATASVLSATYGDPGGCGSSAGAWWIVSIIPGSSGTFALSNGCGTCSGGGLSFNIFSMVFPPGISTPSQMVGHFGTWVNGGTNMAIALTNASLQTENGILSTQTQKTPVNTKQTFTRVNQAQNLLATGAGSDIGMRQAVQTFTAAPALGKYLEITSFFVNVAGVACSGTASIAVSNQFNSAQDWNVSAEAVNVSFSFTATGTNQQGTLTVDWLGMVVSEDIASLSFGTPTFKIFGQTVTEPSGLPAAILTGTYALHYYHSSANDQCMQVKKTAADAYSGGGLFTRNDAASTWTTETGDIGTGFFKVYGGNVVEFRLNATFLDAGGAYYTYVAEHQMDSNTQQAFPISSWGGFPVYGNTLFTLAGGAGSLECSFGGISNRPCVIAEYRLGYVTIPANSTQTLTITFNLNATGRNLFYTGLLANQPTQTHIGRLTFDNQAGTNPDMNVYNLFSFDDYFFQVFFYVNECAAIDGAGLCSQASTTRIPNGSYNGLVRGLRAFSGTWNATGEFNLTGQDLGGGTSTLTLAATNFVTEADLAVTIPSTPGTYFVNLTMVRGTGAGITITAQGVTVTFSPASACLTTGQSLAMNMTRSKPVELWAGLYRLDSIGNPQLITTLFGWTTALNSTILYTFPDGRNFGAADTGKYVLGVFLQSSENVTGKLVNSAKIGVNDVCDFPLGVSFYTNLNEIAQTNIVTATQSTTASIAQREDTAYENYLGALSWAFRRDLFNTPNMVLWLAVFFGLALTLRFGISGMGRRGRDE